MNALQLFIVIVSVIIVVTVAATILVGTNDYE